MATKSGLIASVNGYITAVITQLKLRNGFLDIINELFQTTTTQTLTTGSEVFWYDLRYKKIGNIIFIDGYITSKYTYALESENLVTIPNSLFFAKTGQTTYSIAIVTSSSSIAQSFVNIAFITDKIYLSGSISPNQTIRINSHYQTND
jgi:hypothetical protein